MKAGDTAWDIAVRTGTTVAALLAANHLDPDARIRPGQVLALPPGAHLPSVPTAPRPKPAAPHVVYVVRSGETVSGIAQRFRITVAAILKANKLGKDGVIRPGQKLVLPGVRPRTTAAPPPVTHAYVVQRGDTLSGIAVTAGVPLITITALNHLSASDVIFPGQRLLLPGRAPAAASLGLAAFAMPAPAAPPPSAPPRRRTGPCSRTARLRAPPRSPRWSRSPRRPGATASTPRSPSPSPARSPASTSGGLRRQRDRRHAGHPVDRRAGPPRPVGRRLDLLDPRRQRHRGRGDAARRCARPRSTSTAIAGYYQGLGSVHAQRDVRRHQGATSANVLRCGHRFAAERPRRPVSRWRRAASTEAAAGT